MTRPITVALALFISLVACSGPTEPTAVASVSLSPNTITLASGGSTTLAAATLDSKGTALTGRLITWSSSDVSVAAVSATGVVSAGQNRGGSPALVTISASSEGKTGTATVSVTPVPVAKVIFAVDSIVTEPGVSTQLSIAVQDTAGIALTGRTISWTSLDTTIAKVNASGQVTAGAYTGPDRRDTRVIANAENRADTVQIVVSPLAVARVVIELDSVSIVSGSSRQLSASVQDASGTILSGRPLVWSPTDSSIAKVSALGFVSTSEFFGGQSRVSSVIAASGSKSDTVTVIATPVPVSSVSILGSYSTIAIGGTLTLEATLRDGNGNPLSGRSVTWSSSDSSKISVQQNGTLRGKTTGQALITASSEGKNASVTLTAIEFPGGSYLVAGRDHSCVLTNDGSTMCWGSNGSGQLGNGTTIDGAEATSVIGGLSFVSLTAGFRYTCGLGAGGQAFCWGLNSHGQLGDGTTVSRSSPVAVLSPEPFVSIAAGYISTCGITSAGKTYCWGALRSSGTTSSPELVESAPAFARIAAGDAGQCGITNGLDIYCWARENNWLIPTTTPSIIRSSAKYLAVSVGEYHACAVSTEKQVHCWGVNTLGELGIGRDCEINQVFSLERCAVSSEAKFLSVSASQRLTCGISEQKHAYCWGSNNLGNLGNGYDIRSDYPVRVAGAIDFIEISSGEQRSCAVAISRSVYCWGNYGLLGIGTLAPRTIPQIVTGGHQFREITAGGYGTCGLTAIGDAYCWGSFSNSGYLMENGGLAPSDGSIIAKPLLVPGGMRFQSLTSGDLHVCGLTSQGKAYCWGSGGEGQLGNGERLTKSELPVPVVGDFTFTTLSASATSTCGVIASGEAYCWGSNYYGTLGDGTSTRRLTPTPVSGNHRFITLSGGQNQICGITSSGAGYCWGANGYGGIGDGTTVSRNSPALVLGGLQFSSLSAGAGRTCGLISTGDAYCWGKNDFGQLGDGSTTNRLTPTLVGGGISFIRLLPRASGASCGISGTGTFCWGENSLGAIGDGSLTNRLSPSLVQGSYSFTRLAGGLNHTCGIDLSGITLCWGSPLRGSLGEGSLGQRWLPVPVQGGFVVRSR